MINVRAKGRAGEQEVAHILREELGIEVTRNWAEQSAQGGVDLLGVDGWAIEVKRGRAYRNEWMAQAKRQAEKTGGKPVLIYRLDRRQWMVELVAKDVIPGLVHEPFTVTMPIGAWITVVREKMHE